VAPDCKSSVDRSDGTGTPNSGLYRPPARRRRPQSSPPRPFEIDAGLPLAVRRVIECGESAWARYQPQFYPGKITFLKAGTSVRYPKNPGRIWRKLVGDLEVHTVPGEHLELVGMHAERLARRLSLCVEGALGPDGVE